MKTQTPRDPQKHPHRGVNTVPNRPRHFNLHTHFFSVSRRVFRTRPMISNCPPSIFIRTALSAEQMYLRQRLSSHQVSRLHQAWNLVALAIFLQPRDCWIASWRTCASRAPPHTPCHPWLRRSRRGHAYAYCTRLHNPETNAHESRPARVCSLAAASDASGNEYSVSAWGYVRRVAERGLSAAHLYRRFLARRAWFNEHAAEGIFNNHRFEWTSN